jgi:hypothetical protein
LAEGKKERKKVRTGNEEMQLHATSETAIDIWLELLHTRVAATVLILTEH